ncbi:MAG: FtsB family cell division protein [Anaerolineaceae bacterium]|jgi:cell division protein FtsB
MKKLLQKIKDIKLPTRRIFLIAGIVILVFMMMDFNSRMVTMLQLNREEKHLQTKVVMLEQTKVKLEAQIQYAKSDRALEEWARESGRLINQGDQPVIIVPPKTLKPTPTPQSVQEVVTMDKWQVWRELFFGN